MNLPVYLYGQPVLRKSAEEIENNYPDLDILISNMYDTMYASEGVGLAAPQIGLSLKLIVIDGDVMKESFPECENFKRVMINPRITNFESEKVSFEEGCLSLPGIHESVIRPVNITVEYFDQSFNKVVEDLKGFTARIVQHEYDHLEGKMFIDHISPIRKQLIKAKLNNIIKGKVNCSYRIKKQGK